MRCPSCGTENREGTNFCERCGAPLPKVPAPAAGMNTSGSAFCPSCGAVVAPGATFCPQCGASIGENSAAPMQGQGAVAAPSPYAYQQSYAVQTAPSFSAMTPAAVHSDYSFFKYFILSILTFEIYGLWYEAQMFQDIETMSADPDFKAPSTGAFIGLSFLTFGIYELYWYYKAGEELYKIGPRYGRQISTSGITYVILSVISLSIIGSYLLIKNVNSVAEAYNAAHRGAFGYSR